MKLINLYFVNSTIHSFTTSKITMWLSGAHRAESIKWSMPWRLSNKDQQLSVLIARLSLWLWLHQNCLLDRRSSSLTLTWECQLQVWQLMLVFSAATCEQSAWTTDTPTTSPCLFLGSLETWEINCRFVHFPQLQTPNHYHTLRIFNQTINSQFPFNHLFNTLSIITLYPKNNY